MLSQGLSTPAASKAGVPGRLGRDLRVFPLPTQTPVNCSVSERSKRTRLKNGVGLFRAHQVGRREPQ